MSRSDTATRLRAGIPALQPLAWLYGAGVAVARAHGVRRRPARTPGVRIIAVGNLEVGGNGKTPLALHLLETAASAGRRVAYVSRAFGSRAGRGPHVTLLMPRGGSFAEGVTGLRILERDGRVPLEGEVGDEAALVAEREPRAIIAVSPAKDRALAVAARMGAEIIIVDDAFQSWSLARDIDVVLLDAALPFGPGRLLPAGTLRESPSALRRADAVIFNGARDDAELAAARGRVERWLRPGVAVFGLCRSLAAPSGVDAPGRAFVATGVARPERLKEDLTAIGIAVAGELAFPDHHAYTGDDVARIQGQARTAGADAVVVTEKDWVKLRRFEWTMPVVAVRLRVELFGADTAALLFG